MMCKKDEGIVIPKFAALRAAVFLLSTKTSEGRISAPPPVGARVKGMLSTADGSRQLTVAPESYRIFTYITGGK